jgi:N-acetylmuramoyl-L-alanine amidase
MEMNMKYFIILFILFYVCFKNAQADEVKCLALNIYHEARNQPLVGKLAVAQVTINRVNHNRFPDSVCAVVRQGFYYNQSPIKNKCQFSWWCDGKSDKPKDKASWQEIQILADKIYTGFFDGIDIVKGATHYHANYVKPYWAKDKQKLIKIKNHIFYK